MLGEIPRRGAGVAVLAAQHVANVEDVVPSQQRLLRKSEAMDREVILRKVDALQRCLQRVESRCLHSGDGLAQHPDAQDIVPLNLMRAVQLRVDIALQWPADAPQAELPELPTTMGGAFEALAQQGSITPALALRMKQAVGLRNLAIHAYETIDWEIVHAICSSRLGEFRVFAGAAPEQPA